MIGCLITIVINILFGLNLVEYGRLRSFSSVSTFTPFNNRIILSSNMDVQHHGVLILILILYPRWISPCWWYNGCLGLSIG
jgi:hypothetical protein